MPWARASELERSVSCPASTHLARLEGPRSDAAEWGNIVHEYKETGKWPEGLRKDVVARRMRALESVSATRESLWPPEIGAHEVSFALHTANRIVVSHEGTKDEREAWKKSFDDNWITGTTDWYCPELAPGVAWVDDLKTGRREYLSAPEEAWQLRFYAICATMLTRAENVAVSYLSWPRSPANSTPLRIWGSQPISRTELLTLHLPMLEHARRAALASRTKQEGGLTAPDTVPGAWCRYCKSQGVCPENYEDYIE